MCQGKNKLSQATPPCGDYAGWPRTHRAKTGHFVLARYGGTHNTSKAMGYMTQSQDSAKHIATFEPARQIVYIAGPYRGTSRARVARWIQRKLNIYRARRVARKYWKLGYAVICPHSNTANFDGIIPDAGFLRGDIDIMLRCNIVVMMKRWKDSVGARIEHRVAKQNELIITYER